MAAPPFQRIPDPPSSLTGALGLYLREVARALNDIPQISAYSGVGSPSSSAISGFPGDLAINIGSSDVTRAWIMTGAARSSRTTG